MSPKDELKIAGNAQSRSAKSQIVDKKSRNKEDTLKTAEHESEEEEEEEEPKSSFNFKSAMDKGEILDPISVKNTRMENMVNMVKLTMPKGKDDGDDDDPAIASKYN